MNTPMDLDRGVRALPYLALHFSTMLELTKRHRICQDEPIAKLGCVLAMRTYTCYRQRQTTMPS